MANHINFFYCLALICHKLAVIGFFQRFGPQWVFPSIQGAVEFAKSGEKVVSIVYNCIATLAYIYSCRLVAVLSIT